MTISPSILATPLTHSGLLRSDADADAGRRGEGHQSTAALPVRGAHRPRRWRAARRPSRRGDCQLPARSVCRSVHRAWPLETGHLPGIDRVVQPMSRQRGRAGSARGGRRVGDRRLLAVRDGRPRGTTPLAPLAAEQAPQASPDHPAGPRPRSLPAGRVCIRQLGLLDVNFLPRAPLLHLRVQPVGRQVLLGQRGREQAARP
jgi:hypothetical protein